MRALKISLLVLAATGISALAWRYAGPESASGSSVRERIISCSSRDTVESFELDGINELATETQDCLNDYLLEEFRTGNVDEIDPVLAELAEQSPGFAQFCHTVLHWVGFELGRAEDFAARLRESGSGTCIFGYGHGLLEGFAARHPDPDDSAFEVAVAACEDLAGQAPQSSVTLCADGLGHAAWNSTESIDRAAQLCDLIQTPTLRGVCAGGVIMQIFAPVNDAASSWKEKRALHKDASARLAVICTSWAGGEHGRDGCHSGAGYVYTRPAHVQAAQMMRTTGSNRDELRAAAAASTVEALELCDRHGPTGAALCRTEASRQIPPAAYADAELNRAVCLALTPDGSACPLRPPGRGTPS